MPSRHASLAPVPPELFPLSHAPYPAPVRSSSSQGLARKGGEREGKRTGHSPGFFSSSIVSLGLLVSWSLARRLDLSEAHEWGHCAAPHSPIGPSSLGLGSQSRLKPVPAPPVGFFSCGHLVYFLPCLPRVKNTGEDEEWGALLQALSPSCSRASVANPLVSNEVAAVLGRPLVSAGPPSPQRPQGRPQCPEHSFREAA
ncbi:hypothetical protein CH63R_01831 [Colletotrichum higginsianum IMI 349063]|uniref:Uncharacterized protein n=1 Tax=Colletotrichum higginsianum (strain IMI 349063) TaxID=759273 RepID=A0A1B7YM24_COLHI|nr:hypothetical protein CH63R_01831 [Colletotrichum higginsianum IMI 349063]OBR13105.1 hypothetical protein CH63R_01831 [Colletotrichum higginsianum IMI 349063]